MSWRSIERVQVVAMLGLVSLYPLACAITDPLVENKPITRQRTYAFPKGVLDKVAVMPFYPRFIATGDRSDRAVAPSDAADLVSRFVTEALIQQGLDVVAPSDLEAAFAADGLPTPRLDAKAAAELAVRKFGASAVLLGEVTRYLDRAGGLQPASVAFEITLYTAPAGERAWTSRFDETQQALSENIVNAGRYPGAGSRWLTAAEMARWGAESAIEALPQRH